MDPKRSKRGKGEKGEQWRCLRCMEALCQKLNRWLHLQDPKRIPTSRHPFAEFSQFKFADERTIPQFPKKFSIPLPFASGKWKAVHRWTEYKRKDLRGKSDDRDTVELVAKDCVNTSLLKCLQRICKTMSTAAQARRTRGRYSNATGKSTPFPTSFARSSSSSPKSHGLYAIVQRQSTLS